MRTTFGSIAFAALSALGAGDALGADQEILGARLVVRNPGSGESTRSVVILAKESATEIPAIVGNPLAGGGRLMLGVDSGSSGQSFFLDSKGWTATATGFRYSGSDDPTGPPVKKVALKRTPGGKAFLKVVLSGSVGVQPLDLVPPNPGSDALAILALSNGDAYCASFGGAAGGQVVANTALLWKVRNATAQPACPLLCCGFVASCSWEDAVAAGFCSEVGGTLGAPGAVCDGATGGCVSPPASAGNCCEFGASLCFGGPSVQQPPCDEIGGAFVTGAICDPTQGCVVP
jgi:hypothetical protein